MKKVLLLCGKFVFNLFFENLMCMCMIFEIVVMCLLVDVLNLNINVLLMSKGELLFDMINNLLVMYVDLFVVCYVLSGVLYLIVEYCVLYVYVINVGDGCYVYLM